MPEYLYKRFGGQRIRIYITVLTFINHVFIKIAVRPFEVFRSLETKPIIN